MSDLAALYIDGGYDGYQQITDRIDYIGTCFQYLAAVDLQRAHAVETQDGAEYARLSLCRKVFLEEYLTPWAGEFAERARAFVQTNFFAAVLDLVGLMIERFATTHKTERPIMSAAESSEIALKEDREIPRMVNDLERGTTPDLGGAAVAATAAQA